VLIVQGRQDPIATAETLRRTFPSARPVVELVDDAGHFLWFEQPRPLFRAVAAFLGSLR
jgi:pimeloyl-ACP methyl ester carboxylesterase